MSAISRSSATMASCWVASQAVIWDSVVIGAPASWASAAKQASRLRAMSDTALAHWRGSWHCASRMPWRFHCADSKSGGFSVDVSTHRLIWAQCFQTGTNVGDWFVIVTYADSAAYENAQTMFAQDPEYQQVITDIAKITKRINREMVIDLDL